MRKSAALLLAVDVDVSEEARERDVKRASGAE